MREELKDTCKYCSIDVSKYDSFCSEECEDKYDKKNIKQFILYLVVVVISVTLVATLIVEFEPQISDFFNVIGQHLRNTFYSLPSFFQTFLSILSALLLVVSALFCLVIMRSE